MTLAAAGPASAVTISVDRAGWGAVGWTRASIDIRLALLNDTLLSEWPGAPARVYVRAGNAQPIVSGNALTLWVDPSARVAPQINTDVCALATPQATSARNQWLRDAFCAAAKPAKQSDLKSWYRTHRIALRAGTATTAPLASHWAVYSGNNPSARAALAYMGAIDSGDSASLRHYLSNWHQALPPRLQQVAIDVTNWFF